MATYPDDMCRLGGFVLVGVRATIADNNAPKSPMAMALGTCVVGVFQHRKVRSFGLLSALSCRPLSGSSPST